MAERQMTVAGATYDNHTPELIDAALPDILEALARGTEHPDADALMDRAYAACCGAFPAEGGWSDDVGEIAFRILVGVGLSQHAPIRVVLGAHVDDVADWALTGRLMVTPEPMTAFRVGPHRAESEQNGRLHARCREYENTIAELHEQLEQAQNGEQA